MALQSYIKDLVGDTSDVQIVNDNSTSNLPSFEYILNPQHENNVVDLSNSNNMMCPRSRSDAHVKYCSPSNADSCPSTPVRHRQASDTSILEDFRERQRMIQMSLSPGVLARTPNNHRARALSPSRTPLTPPHGNNRLLQSKKKCRVPTTYSSYFYLMHWNGLAVIFIGYQGVNFH
jgi:hypothetical protein